VQNLDASRVRSRDVLAGADRPLSANAVGAAFAVAWLILVTCAPTGSAMCQVVPGVTACANPDTSSFVWSCHDQLGLHLCTTELSRADQSRSVQVVAWSDDGAVPTRATSASLDTRATVLAVDVVGASPAGSNADLRVRASAAGAQVTSWVCASALSPPCQDLVTNAQGQANGLVDGLLRDPLVRCVLTRQCIL